MHQKISCKWIQQNCRFQGIFKNHLCFLHSQWKIYKRKFWNFIYSSIQQDKMLRNKFNQGSKTCIHWKLQKSCKKKSQVHGLQDLMLLKWQYFQKWSAGSVQCLSQFQMSSLQKWRGWASNSYGIQQIPNSQSHTEKEKQIWRTHSS